MARILWTIAFAGAAVTLAYLGLSRLESWRCATTWPGRETVMVSAIGCMVKVDGQFVPSRNVIIRTN